MSAPASHCAQPSHATMFVLCCAVLCVVDPTTGSLGKRMACSSAVLGLYFSVSESYLSNLADGRVPDDLCTIGAGACWSIDLWNGAMTVCDESVMRVCICLLFE